MINWKRDRTGSPENWYTQQKQGEKKLMVFSVMRGSGQLFGPYFLPHGSTFNAQSYRRMLEDEVFPDMRNILGIHEFNQSIWMQVFLCLHMTTGAVYQYTTHNFSVLDIFY